eukprot:1194764-Prorocentrum_minimum.AAC.2
MITAYQRQRCSRFPEAEALVFQAGSGSQDVSILGPLATQGFTPRVIWPRSGCQMTFRVSLLGSYGQGPGARCKQLMAACLPVREG